MPKTHVGQMTSTARKARKRLKNETAEHKEVRLARQRESNRRRYQKENLLEKEERLARARWYASNIRRRESFASRERRLEQRRIQVALQRSQMREEMQKINRLMQTEQAFETILTKQIRDQLHQIYRKVIRLSATNVKHMHIAPDTLDKDSNSEALCDTTLPIYSCPMEDGLNSEDESPLEPKIVVSELENFPDPPMVQIKAEPMASEPFPIHGNNESDDSDMIIGDPDVSSNSEPNVKAEPMAGQIDNPEVITGDIHPNPELITGIVRLSPELIKYDVRPDTELITCDIRPDPEPMISETDNRPKPHGMNIETSASAVIKSEINIKPEVYTE